jgi:hypothetical protein
LYCLGNPVKFADPTGMQIVTPSDMPLTGPTGVVPQNGGGAVGVVNTYWEYDPSNSCNPVWLVVEGSYNGANNSNDYFVNYATSGNSAYAASITAAHKNAIDWQIANAGAKAMEGVNVGRNATIGPYSGSFNEWMVETPENFFHAKKYNGHSIVDIGSIISGSIGISTAWTEQVLADASVDLLRNCGTAGKIMGGASVSMGIAGTVLGVVSGWKTKESGNPRGYLDIGVAFAGGGTAIAMTNGIIGTGGWFVVIPCAIYGIAVGIYDW